MVIKYYRYYINFLIKKIPEVENELFYIKKEVTRVKNVYEKDKTVENYEIFSQELNRYRQKEKEKNLLEKIYLRQITGCTRGDNNKQKIITFIFKEFCNELADLLIKNIVNPIKIGHFGKIVILSKDPKATITKNNKVRLPVDYRKSLKKRKEIIAEGKIPQGKNQEGEKWLMVKTEPYPILKWIPPISVAKNYVFNARDTYYAIKHLRFKANSRYIKAIYAYYRNRPDIIKQYNISGNGWHDKYKSERNTR